MPNTGTGQSPARGILGSGFEQSALLRTTESAQSRRPHSWWCGPLNVEQLALRSVALVADAIESLDAQLLRGTFGPVTARAEQVAAAFGSTAHLRINGNRVKGFAQHSGFYRTMDGWVRTHANYPHHEHRLLQALGAQGRVSLADALQKLTSIQAQELIVDAGGIAAKVQSRKQWLGSAAGKAAQEGHWAQFSHHHGTGQSVWEPNAEGYGPLSGLKVLDMTRVIAGPTATKTLAAFGAQVLRVDGPRFPELTEQHIDTGFSKRSTVLDISNPADKSVMDDLLAETDVLICGYRPGSLGRFGLGITQLQEKYPNMIIAELNAWGYDGPSSARRGFDSIVQAACGIADAYRSEDGTPGALPVQALDHATGYGLAAAIISMAQARVEHRIVGHVRFSLARTAEALFAFGTAVEPPEELKLPELGHKLSPYGNLEYALPPFEVNGQSLDFPASPPRYGEDHPLWL
ncbi:CoA transferase [Glutamicibacter sp. JC586]|uniref:CoA transferase n=1 Tax=Glutamicibacter sp. JC586 TaxID=2590552 RepID=UPI00135C1962|nr:CoA transferase [Glutamicibacter sp. JC586]